MEVPGVSILLVERQQSEHDHKAIPVGQLPPEPQQVRVPSLQMLDSCLSPLVSVNFVTAV